MDYYHLLQGGTSHLIQIRKAGHMATDSFKDKRNAHNALYLENIMLLRWPSSIPHNLTHHISHNPTRIIVRYPSSFVRSPCTLRSRHGPTFHIGPFWWSSTPGWVNPDSEINQWSTKQSTTTTTLLKRRIKERRATPTNSPAPGVINTSVDNKNRKNAHSTRTIELQIRKKKEQKWSETIQKPPWNDMAQP